MPTFLNVNTVFLNIGSYPLSYIEFVGTILYFTSVFLISRKYIVTWPVGIISVILYGILFYQIQLYSDMIEQLYYLIISIVGWIAWSKVKKEEHAIPSVWSSVPIGVITIFVTIVLSVVLAYCVKSFHIWFPALFPSPASYPYIDALTTIMSFTAMYLTTRRRNEGWLYWIIVDCLGIWLYWIKDVKFISFQYVFLLFLAIYGLMRWLKKP